MKFFKKLFISLLSISLMVIIPTATVFADENDDYSTMPIGRPITNSFQSDDTVAYRDGSNITYIIEYRLNLTYEKTKNGNNFYVKDVVINSCSIGVRDNNSPQDGTYWAREVSSNCKIDNSGSRPYAVVTAVVEEYVRSLDKTTRTFTHRFAL